MPVLTREKTPTAINLDNVIKVGEAIAFCPHCKALQTVWISENGLLTTRKFYQKGNQVYHDCGSKVPCRLYQDW